MLIKRLFEVWTHFTSGRSASWFGCGADCDPSVIHARFNDLCAIIERVGCSLPGGFNEQQATFRPSLSRHEASPKQ